MQTIMLNDIAALYQLHLLRVRVVAAFCNYFILFAVSGNEI